MQRVFFRDVNLATGRVLAAEGFEVEAPRAPRCCGALQLHSGDDADAAELAKRTIAAFEGYDHVVVNAAGCGSAMKDYGHLLRDDPGWAERAAAFSARVRDVTELLHEAGPRAAAAPGGAAGRLPRRLPPGPRAGRARAAARAAAPRSPASSWSSRPSGSSAAARPASTTCSSPSRRAELGERKARNLLATGAEAVIAGNPGCALQIAAHSERLGRRLRVYHPMEVLSDVDRWRATEMSIEVRAPLAERFEEVLTDDALALVGALHERFEPSAPGAACGCGPSAGSASTPASMLDFLDETREVREGDWRVAPPPDDLQDRRVEITGPTSARW